MAGGTSGGTDTEGGPLSLDRPTAGGVCGSESLPDQCSHTGISH